jgi:hypothetical protein
MIGMWVLTVLYVLIIIVATGVIGLAFYVGANTLIDRYQGWTRRKPMATRKSPEEILRARQRKAAGRKAQVMDASLRIPTLPYEWTNVRKR